MVKKRKSLTQFITGVFALMLVLCALPVMADDDCDDPNNDAIVPELALCSTHAFNVGWDTNPESAADKEVMQEVIALKTTIITQQMYKQYEYMDAMVSRLKTQLEKAILANKLQAAGAADEERKAATTTPRERNIKLDGATDCSRFLSDDEMINCFVENINLVLETVNTNKISAARDQLKTDYEMAVRYKLITKADTKSCPSMSVSVKPITSCADELRAAFVIYKRAAAKEAAKKKKDDK